MKKQVGFVCFGEVNTPIERLNLKHDDALSALAPLGYNLLDGGLVIDDPGYQTADAAVEKLRGFDMACLIGLRGRLDPYPRSNPCNGSLPSHSDAPLGPVRLA